MKAYLGLGTNLGDKEANLHAAIKQINEKIGEVTSLSSFYVTAPWGFSSENSFLNAACCVDTELTPLQLLEETQAIERSQGRLEKSVNHRYADRLIDIDLLLYEDLIWDTPQLQLPHPLMTERRFVMDPLTEIAPDVVHPLLKKKLKELAGHNTK